jgi:hypothetical protein
MTRCTLPLSGLVVLLSGVFFAAGCDKGSPTHPTAAFLRKAVVSDFNILGSGSILGVGQTTLLAATMKTPQGVGIVTDRVTWTTLDPNIATVSATGLVTAVAIGTTTVKAVFDADETSLPINVLEISGLTVSGALVNNSLAFTSIGATSQLSLTATWPGGITRQVAALATWSSSNPAVASVTSNGLVRSVAFGSTTITATYLTKSISVTVNVTPLVTSVFLSGGLSLTAAGQTGFLTATARFADASTKDVTTEATWTSSDVSVATVSAGFVTATGLGKTTIQATYSNRSGFTTVQVTPAGTFVILGRVRDPGQGQGAGLGVPGFTVRDVMTGRVTTTDASGDYSLGGIFPGDRVIYEKAGWETVERVFNSGDDDAQPGAQRVVSISAGSTAVISTAPNDVVYQLQPGVSCTPCRLVRVQSSTSGTLHLTLTWTGTGPRLNLWIDGQMYSSNGIAPIRVVVDIPVNPGETLVYAGLVGGQPFSTGYMTVTLATSIGPAPEPAAKAGVLAAPAGDARRKR